MIKAKKSLGQNFLIDREILEKIVNTTAIKDKNILEVGPGTGNLTSFILKNNPKKMAQIFYKMFNCPSNTVINFLSNKSNILEDVSIISKMPKWIFLKQLI